MSRFLIFVVRMLLSALFLVGSYWHLTHWSMALVKTAATGVERPDLILIVATLFLIVGGISLLLGYKTRWGICLLIIEMISTAVIFHPFWSVASGEKLAIFLQFLHRLAPCAALLLLLVTGSGSLSLERS